MNNEETSKLAVFEGKQIRKILHEGEWWFSIIDVVEVLVGGDRPRKYWNYLKKKLTAEGYSEVSEKIGQLKMAAPDGKQRLTDCAKNSGDVVAEVEFTLRLDRFIFRQPSTLRRHIDQLGLYY